MATHWCHDEGRSKGTERISASVLTTCLPIRSSLADGRPPDQFAPARTAIGRGPSGTASSAADGPAGRPPARRDGSAGTPAGPERVSPGRYSGLARFSPFGARSDSRQVHCSRRGTECSKAVLEGRRRGRAGGEAGRVAFQTDRESAMRLLNRSSHRDGNSPPGGPAHPARARRDRRPIGCWPTAGRAEVARAGPLGKITCVKQLRMVAMSPVLGSLASARNPDASHLRGTRGVYIVLFIAPPSPITGNQEPRG